MPMITMPVKSRCGPPMKLLPTLTVAEVTNAIAAMRNMAWWKSAGIRSFSAIPRPIQRVFRPLPATPGPHPTLSQRGGVIALAPPAQPQCPYGQFPAAERVSRGTATAGGKPGRARLPAGRGLRTRTRPALRVPLRPVFAEAERRGGPYAGAAGPGPSLGADDHRRDQAGDAAPRPGHQHPERARRGAAFRAAQFSDPLALVPAGCPDRPGPFRGARALPLHVPRASRRHVAPRRRRL